MAPAIENRNKILVVEDDPMNMTLVKEMLSMSGYEVVEAIDGEVALKLAESALPDLVLMDLHLPVMDGVSTMKAIKSDKARYGDLPVVALTASAMKGDEQKILSEGFDGYVPKPIQLKKLLDTVAGLLNGDGHGPS